MAGGVRKNFLTIQYLRAFAALIVVLHHALGSLPQSASLVTGFTAGAAGVDIFFFISGFIMYVSARDEPAGEFVRRRIIRIVPLYWLATFMTFAYLNRRLVSLPDPEQLWHLGASLFFIPHYSPLDPGQIWPVVVPGWTLNFEMFFYAIFALGLLVRRLVPFVAATIGALVVTGQLLPSDNALWSTYTSLKMCEFLAGLLVARYALHVSRGWGIGLLLAGTILLMSSDMVDAPSVVKWGLPSAMMVIGAISIEWDNGVRESKFALMLGNASYSIYLFQIIGLVAGSRLSHSLQLGGLAGFLVHILGTMTIAIIAGLVAHHFLELPMTRFLRRHFFARGQETGQVLVAS